MQNIGFWSNAWNKLFYGWDLNEIGKTLFVSPDFSHWSVGENPKVIEEKFVKQLEEKEVKAIIYKGTDANKFTGKLFTDTSATFWWRLGGKYNLLRGCYHWLQYSVDPTVAFNYHNHFIKEYPTELPYFLDFEEPSVKSASDYIWRASVWLALAENELKNDLPVVYTGGWYLDKIRSMLGSAYISKIGWMQKYPLWLALYNRKYPEKFYLDKKMPNALSPWGLDDWVIWQYTDKADFPYYDDGDLYWGDEWGIPSKGLDMNLIKSSWLEKYLSPEIPPVDPPEPPVPPFEPPIEPCYELTYKTLYNMNVRSGAGTNYGVVGSLPQGSIVDALDVGGANSWILTKKGWICNNLNGKQYLEKED